MEKNYCPYCKKLVVQGIKYYGFRGNYRVVCSGGCNTDWREIKEYNIEKRNKKIKWFVDGGNSR